MWSIKQRRTKPRENKAKTGVIYPKFNATAKPNRYVNRNTYLDVKCNRDKGAGCTIVGCQCSTDASGNTYCCKISLIFQDVGILRMYREMFIKTIMRKLAVILLIP